MSLSLYPRPMSGPAAEAVITLLKHAAKCHAGREIWPTEQADARALAGVLGKWSTRGVIVSGGNATSPAVLNGEPVAFVSVILAGEAGARATVAGEAVGDVVGLFQVNKFGGSDFHAQQLLFSLLWRMFDVWRAWDAPDSASPARVAAAVEAAQAAADAAAAKLSEAIGVEVLPILEIGTEARISVRGAEVADGTRPLLAGVILAWTAGVTLWPGSWSFAVQS